MTFTRVTTMACFAATVALLGGCGTEVSVDSSGKVAVGDKTIDVAGLPFTVRYPNAFREATDASLKEIGAVAVVGPTADSYIAIRRNGSRPMTLKALEAQARRGLGDSVQRVARGEHSGIAMIAVSLEGGDSGRWSKIYGFSLAGATWLVDCRSTPGDLSVMRPACAQAVDTIEPRAG